MATNNSPETFTLWKEFVESTAGESLENFVEGQVKFHGSKTGNVVHAVLVKYGRFLKNKTALLLVGNALAAGLVKVLGVRNPDVARVLYGAVRHLAGGATEGAAETLKAAKDDKAWDTAVKDAIQVASIAPAAIPDGAVSVYVHPEVAYGHRFDPATGTTFCDVLGTPHRRHLMDNAGRTKVLKVPSVDPNTNQPLMHNGRPILVDQTFANPMPFAATRHDLFEFVKGADNKLCPSCFPHGAPEKDAEKKKEAEPKGRKEKYGVEVMNVITAAKNRLAKRGRDLPFAIDQLQDWPSVDADSLKATCAVLHGRIVDARFHPETGMLLGGELTDADLDRLILDIPVDGKENLTFVSKLRQLRDGAKQLLGYAPKEDDLPLLEKYSFKLVDFLRATEKLPKKSKKSAPHLAEVLKVPDLKHLEDVARANWTPKFHETLDFKDAEKEAFHAWDTAVHMLVKGHEYDQERKNPTLHRAKPFILRTAAKAKFWSKSLFVLFAVGWSFAGLRLGGSFDTSVFGLYVALGSGLALTLIVIAGLLPVELIAAIGDVLLKDKNRIDDTVKSVRQTLMITLGTLTIAVIPAHAAQMGAGWYFPVFVLLLVGSMVVTACVEKAFVDFKLRTPLLLVAVLVGGVITTIASIIVVMALHNAFPEAKDDINDAMLGIIGLLAFAGVVAGAVYLFKKVYQKLDDSGHGGILGFIATGFIVILVMGAGIRVVAVLGMPAILDKVAIVLDKAITIQKNEQDASASANAGTTTDSSVPGDKQSELNQKALDALKGSAAPQPADKQAEAAGKPRTLEQVQKLLAAVEAVEKLERDISTIAGQINGLEKQRESESDPVKLQKLEDQVNALTEKQKLLSEDLGKAKSALPAEVEGKGSAAYAKQLRDELKALQGTQQKGNGGTKAKDEDKPQVASSDSLSVEAYCKGLPNKFRVGKCEKYKG